MSLPLNSYPPGAPACSAATVSVVTLWAVAASVVAGFVIGALVAARERTRVEARTAAVSVNLALGAQPGMTVDGGLLGLERAAEAVLEELGRAGGAEALLREALDEVAEAVVIAGPGGEIVLRNRAAASLRDERTLGALLDEAVAAALEEAGGGEAVDRELDFYGPPRRELFMRARPLVIAGDGSGAVALIADVSDARRVDSVRRDFVANVSHELRTPIGAVVLLGETILAAEDTAVTTRLAERIVKEAERLERIVDDLLDLSVIEAEEAPAREPVPVGEIVSEAVEHVRAVAEVAGTPIEVVGAPPDLALEGDRRQLVGALVNLLENAVKYSERGSRVEVRAARGDGCATIAVSDRGIGIPSRHLERIFERFYRVDRARSRDSGGTGLGLSIVRHVARAHGGDVSVESREGEGSTFCLVLPAYDLDEAGTKYPPVPVAPAETADHEGHEEGT